MNCSNVSEAGSNLIPYNDTVRRILNATDNYELLKQLTERYLRQIRGKIYRTSLANKVKLCYDKGDINCSQKYCNYSPAISKNLDSETTVKCSPTFWNCYGSMNAREFVSNYLESNALQNNKYNENVDKRKQLEQQIDLQHAYHRLNVERLEEISTIEVAEDDHQTECPFHIQTQIKNQNDTITKSSKSITTTPSPTTICEPTISINITRDRSGRSARPNNTEGNKRHINNEQQQQRIRSKINLQPLKSSLGKLIRYQNIKDQNSSSVVSNIANEEDVAQLIRIEIKQIILNEKRP